MYLIIISLTTSNNENSSPFPPLLSLPGRPQFNIMNHLVLDVWVLPGVKMTFSTGHVRLWEKGSSWPQEKGQNPCPWEQCQMSLKSTVKQLNF